MPCRTEEMPHEIAARQSKTKTNQEILIQEQKARMDSLTRSLCYVMNSLKHHDQSFLVDLTDHNVELGLWWKKHQEEDDKRAFKENALNKLTPDERTALGL